MWQNHWQKNMQLRFAFVIAFCGHALRTAVKQICKANQKRQMENKNISNKFFIPWASQSDYLMEFILFSQSNVCTSHVYLQDDLMSMTTFSSNHILLHCAFNFLTVEFMFVFLFQTFQQKDRKFNNKKIVLGKNKKLSLKKIRQN